MGDKMGESGGGDFVEIEISVKASANYQSVGASFRWKTSDPKYLPVHGMAASAVSEKLAAAADVVVAAVSSRLPVVIETVEDLSKR